MDNKDTLQQKLSKCVDKALTIVFALEVAFTIGIYIWLKTYDQFIAECWLAFAYIWAVRGNTKSIDSIVKDEVNHAVEDEIKAKLEKTKDITNEDKDIEDNQDKSNPD